MTIEEAYPGCPDAVKWMEHPGYDSMWRFLRLIEEDDPRLVAQRIKESFGKVLTEYEGPYRPPPQVGPQMNHPDFVRYVAGKLGAM